MHRRLAVLGALGALLLAAGCAGDESDVGPETGDGAAAVELGMRDDTGPAPAGRDTAPSEEPVEPDPADDITTVVVEDAGEIDVRVDEAGQVELVDVRPTDGWRHAVDDQEADEIELEFRHENGRTLEVEITVDQGELRTEID